MPEKNLNPRETSQLVNKVGQYLYKNIDSAYKGVRSTNTYDVYFFVLYQIPFERRIPGKRKEGYNDMHEMHINISLTTYQNKIRTNVTEISPEEWTFGYILVPPEKLKHLEDARTLIYNKVIEKLKKHYKDYDFIF